jgi:hypothetical protein
MKTRDKKRSELMAGEPLGSHGLLMVISDNAIAGWNAYHMVATLPNTSPDQG